MIDLNALSKLMDFYKTNGLGPKDYSSGFGFNPTPINANANAANWAMGAMGGGMGGMNAGQQYFSSPAPGYTAPTQFNPGAQPASKAPPPTIPNYLATLLRIQPNG